MINSIRIFDHIKTIIQQFTENYSIPIQLMMTPSLEYGHISSNFIKILQSKKVDESMIIDIINKINDNLNFQWIEKTIIKDNFFNIFINNSVLNDHLINIIHNSSDDFFTNSNDLNVFLSKTLKNSQSFHWEFGSINPTGPIHLGHLRAIFYAQSLSNLYKSFNIPVYKEFFLNDCGHQIDEFLKSIHMRWQQSQGIAIEDSCIPYKGSYIKELIMDNMDNNPNNFYHHKKEIIEKVKNKTIEALASMAINYDAITYESHLRQDNDLIIKVFNILQNKQLIGLIDYQDQLLDLENDILPWNNKIINIPDETVVLLTKSLGFKKNKVIMKNKDLTYFGADIIYLYHKYNRGFHYQVCFLGEDHIGHLTMLQTLWNHLFDDGIFLPKKVGFVKAFDENNEIIPMSKRQGKFLSLEDAKKTIGIDFLKLIMISRNNNGEIHFKVSDAHDSNIQNNCLFYIQYCYARISSLINRCEPLDLNILLDNTVEIMAEEKSIIKQLFWLNWKANQWIMDQDIHSLYNYIYNLCGEFHGYYSMGSVDPKYRIIGQNPSTHQWRLRILYAIKKTLKILLDIIAIKPMEKM